MATLRSEGPPIPERAEASEMELTLILELASALAETIAPALPSATPLDAIGPEFCRVLIMTEEVADWLGDSLIEWQLSNRYPLVVEMPGLMGRLPGRKTLVDSIREAIGVSV